MSLTRRSFLGAAAAAAAMPTLGVAFADENPAQSDELYGQIPVDEDIVAATGWTGTPKEIERLGGSNMPLEALNMYRKKYIDSMGEIVGEDGTVVPAVYVKVRALINTYGYGMGGNPSAAAFTDMMNILTEDEAAAFVSTPWGKEFRPVDWAAECGRPVEECAELCEKFAGLGYLCRLETSGGYRYHHMAYVQGIAEIRQIMKAAVQESFSPGLMDMSTLMVDQAYTGTHLLTTIPCDADLVVDSGIMPYDDIKGILDAADVFAVAPCACRYAALNKAGLPLEEIPTLEQFHAGEVVDWISPLAGRRVETCLHMGDEARYHISTGNARELTREEAEALMQRAVEEGFILQRLFSKDAQTICSCEVGSCSYLKGFVGVGAGAPEQRSFASARSHYDVVVDTETCAKCGACAERCPMKVIVMDEETGLPTLYNETYGELCFGCGQCAYVCPMGARSLVARPVEDIPELPQNILEDHNMKAAYRFEHGMMGL